MSLTLTLYGTKSQLDQAYFPPIALAGNAWSIGLIEFSTFNSIPNVEETNNKLLIRDHAVEIPVGTYEIDELNDYLDNIVKSLTRSDKDYLHIKGNNNTMKCEIESTLPINLSVPNSIAPLLGFQPTLLAENKKHTSQLPVDIIKVNDVRIECNIASGSFENGQSSHTIYGFYPDVPPGYKLVQRPTTVIYYPVTTSLIDHLLIRIVDQNGQLVNFRGEYITVRLHLRKE